MKDKKILDLDNLKIVDASEIPERVRYSPYREILKRIPKGKALVVSEKDGSLPTVRNAVLRLKKKGEFKKFTVYERRTESGEHMLYIVNSGDEEKEKASRQK